MVLCLGEAVIWVEYKKSGVEGKTAREVSMRLPFKKLDDFHGRAVS